MPAGFLDADKRVFPAARLILPTGFRRYVLCLTTPTLCPVGR